MTRKSRWLAATAALMILPAGLVGCKMLPSSAATLPATGGTYQLKVTKSGMCVDVPGTSSATGALLQQ
ncbi:RICIN domain-containing protein [Paractinoplanes abujensis]|uniref:Lipoprotein n=1 Tax=Paractinoplanes abujensis TaxID=882441 RepID=A0A7W7CXE0_9ACTN|nr:RICIN domain-containing protein [Actinoplanes abujensis]MBB4696244.1 hypothetical protein [Actinoplanes abujensis]